MILGRNASYSERLRTTARNGALFGLGIALNILVPGCGSAGGTGAKGATGVSTGMGIEVTGDDGGSNVLDGTDGGATVSGEGSDGSNTDPGDGAAKGSSTSGLHVEGNHLVDNGKVVRILGVAHSGTESECVLNNDIFQGPSDASLVTPMLAWDVNAVRVPLNETCWLGLDGLSSTLSGTTYQNAIATYVQMIRSKGLYVIVDLHWNGPGTNVGKAQQPMADADHSPAFWTSVADTFKSDTGIIFDLYNEPYVTAWSCWLSGCSESGWNGISGKFPTAGMQSLVDAVRGTGATNVLMLGGIAYANDLTGWLANEPTDPAGQLAASFHNYNFNVCTTESCWNSQIAPVAAKVPVITGELGENDCADGYIDGYMSWADTNGVSYVGWAWNTWDCGSGPSLITNYNGTATAFGAGYKAHLMAINP